MDKELEDKLLQKKIRRRELFITYLITAGIALVIGAIIFCLMFFLRTRDLLAACDAAIVTGASLICIGLLILLARLGAFDTFAFGFMQLGTSMFGKNPCKYPSLVEYKQARYDARKEKSKYWIVVMIVGGLFIIAFIVLRIIFKIQKGI